MITRREMFKALIAAIAVPAVMTGKQPEPDLGEQLREIPEPIHGLVGAEVPRDSNPVVILNMENFKSLELRVGRDMGFHWGWILSEGDNYTMDGDFIEPPKPRPVSLLRIEGEGDLTDETLKSIEGDIFGMKFTFHLVDNGCQYFFNCHIVKTVLNLEEGYMVGFTGALI